MAGLEALTAMIYHERQQEGSMLCAQHALNSLLQGNYFTAPDLAAIARSFDALEHDALDADDAQRSGSHNMDDTGFFSVQVIDQALDVWGLNLVRWRSEQMRPYQDSPHKLLAFVLNLQQHWFTLRRFGPARTSIESDPGEGHWFNLNSSYVAPKWVSRTYLGMFLQQSEEEGYSVFAVVQADPTKPIALPRTEADIAAATLDAPDSAPGHSFASSSSVPGAFPGAEEVLIPDEEDYNIDSEDVELQAALAASLTGADQSFGQHAYVPRAPVPAPSLRQAPAPPPLGDDMDVESSGPSTPSQAPGQTGAEQDLVAASMARSRQMLERMQRMQEEALRETYEGEATSAGQLEQQQASVPQRRRTREEEDQEELERAIAASIAEHNAQTGEGGDEDEDGSGEDWLPEESNKENAPTGSQSQRPQLHPGAVSSGPSTTGVTSGGVRTESGEIVRVYDDEDEALQEALRASLQSMPEGFVHAPTPPRPEPITPPSAAAAASAPPASGTSKAAPRATPGDEEMVDADTVAEADADAERASSPPPPPAQVDLEEMRRRRLARFAGASASGAAAAAPASAAPESGSGDSS
ncbi:hypothetical protein ACEPAF_7306 [Sanghuangporus sanghuang]